MQEEDLLDKPLVAVVILSWNGKTFLESFLPSVVRSTYKPLDIFVVDNASTDGTIEFLQNKYPQIKIISLRVNEGFAKGYNSALQQVYADYFILLNQDVEITEGWVEPLVECMQADVEIAACQPKMLAFKQKDYFEHAGAGGGYLDMFSYPFCRGRIFQTIEQDNGQYQEADEIFWASGAALCIRAELFKRFRGFDADFFAHMEEIDLCWRLKNAGYKIFYVPESIVYHVGGGSLQKENPRKTYLNFRNNLYMIFKNMESYEIIWKLPMRFFILEPIACLNALRQKKWSEAGAIIKADINFLISIPKLLKKRIETYFLFRRHRIRASRVKQKGYFKKSIVWLYFVKKKKYFHDL